ncbi:MAG: DUF1223 domain-containing protein [Rhodobacteraceae bacterium]|nr:DUF1223 domain-containing protein [Paracoccaceae bacterium]
MSKVNLFLGAALLLAPVVANAENPVVVELYTSQGCSSCPPADRLLASLATHDNIIALAFHVDYWDYLGWADDFAKPEYSNRQRLYARAWNERSVYTPQMVVQGVHYMVGSRNDEIQRQIMQAEEIAPKVQVTARNEGRGISIRMEALSGATLEADIFLVRFSESETVVIERGENAGRTIDYINIVKSWETLGRWDGNGTATVSVPQAEAGEYVVIIQAPGPGEIYAATKLSH